MIEIKIPKEIRKYKEKFLFGLTFRQTLCTGAALLINVPLYLFLSDAVNKDVAGWAVMLTAAPFALVGFIKYNGMNFEKLMVCIAEFYFTLQKRVYKTENLYAWLREECEEAE